eukprot:7530851-Alexandrium_andersonii.AAC.1
MPSQSSVPEHGPLVDHVEELGRHSQTANSLHTGGTRSPLARPGANACQLQPGSRKGLGSKGRAKAS